MKHHTIRNYVYFFVVLTVVTCFLICNKTNAFAKIEWEVLKDITFEEQPIDMAISKDNATIYILSDKNILIYSVDEKKVTDTIPLSAQFSRIAISSDGERIFLTDPKSKKLSIIQISTVYDIEAGQSPVIGKADAPVSVFAFLDFQCPYCAKAYPMLEDLLAKYPEKVNIIIKHYPLRMHRFAEKASIAALAASKQNKYQEMTKALFGNYKNLNDEIIKKYAEDSGLNIQDFDKDSNDPVIKDILKQDMSMGARLQIRGVPSLYINGLPVKNRSLDALSSMVEQELKKNE